MFAASGWKKRPRLHGAQTFREEGRHAAGPTSPRIPGFLQTPQTSILSDRQGPRQKRSYTFSQSTRNLSLPCDRDAGRRTSETPAASSPQSPRGASDPGRALVCGSSRAVPAPSRRHLLLQRPVGSHGLGNKTQNRHPQHPLKYPRQTAMLSVKSFLAVGNVSAQ